MPDPLVSILLPVHNGERYLRQSIDSLLGQSFGDYELLILDDGSTDDSREIARSYEDTSIRVLTQENQGLTKSLNRLLKEARGDLIARADADDMYDRERLGAQVRVLDQGPEVGVAGSFCRFVDDAGIEKKQGFLFATDAEIRRRLRLEPSIPHSGAVVRKKLYDQVGGYDEQYAVAQGP